MRKLVEARKYIFFIMLVVASIAIFTISKGELRYSVEFTGGVVYETNLSDISGSLTNDIDYLLVDYETLKTSDGFSFKFKELSDLKKKEVAEMLGDSMLSMEEIGSSLGDEVKSNSVTSFLLAVLFLSVFLFLRYNFVFAISSMVAIMHDVLIAFAIVMMLGITINTVVVGGILAIIGYSINDTVVLLDKIRGTIRAGEKVDITKSIMDIMPRTIKTSLSTLAATTSLLIFGGDMLRGFSVVITAGVIVGTMSSIFIVPVLISILSSKGEVSIKEKSKPSVDGDI